MNSDVITFLEPFPPADREPVEAALARDSATAVMLDGPEVQEFRRDPVRALRLVSEVLAGLWRDAPPRGRVVCCYRGDLHTGLDDFELDAVLSRHMHVERIAGTMAAGDGKRLLAVGALREEYVALSFRLPEDAAVVAVSAALEALRIADVPAAVLFMSDRSAATIEADSALIAALRRLLGDRPTRIGAWIPAGRTDQVLRDPAAELAALRRLDDRIACVRFENADLLDSGRLHLLMRTTGFSCDSSMPVDGGAVVDGSPVRRGAYAGSSPYWPQPFDLRTPRLSGDDHSWIEVAPVPVEPGALPAWWSSRFGPSDAELAGLLDSARIEAFFRLSRIAPREERRYADVRVYNWPASAPAHRVTLIDGGVAEQGRVRALASEASALASQGGPRMRVASHDDFLRVARGEVSARYSTSRAASIGIQNDVHEYLEHIPLDAPLRPDYADFVRFMPALLGDALEIGSGYGALAWALSPRSRRYVRLDLESRMFASLRRDLGQHAVLADMHKLPFRDASFDSVVANNVLEHLHDALGGLREIRRIMRPGGSLFGLIPLDALNSHHELEAHHWKTDAAGIERALGSAGYRVSRLEVVSLYDLGVPGAFPSCNGLGAKVEAIKEDAVASDLGERTVHSPQRIHGTRSNPSSREADPPRLSGRLLPAVREVAAFERWAGRRVLVAGLANDDDAAEFARYGAEALLADAELSGTTDGSVDCVYAFLAWTSESLPRALAAAHRALAPGGTLVAVLRNAASLHYLARIRAYFGSVCELSKFGEDVLVRLAEGGPLEGGDEGIVGGAGYVLKRDVIRSLSVFREPSVTVGSLTPDDLPGVDGLSYPPPFWAWLSGIGGQYVFAKAVK